MSDMRMRTVAACACLCLAGAGTRAQEEQFPTGLLDRAQAVALAASATLEKFPDAEEAAVSSVLHVRYRPDGTYVQWQEAYVKILTEQARRRYRTLSSFFTIPYQRGPEDCAVTCVDLIKPDGRCVAIDVAAQSRVMVNPDSMDANIYNPNDKLVQVNVPGIEVGDLLHYVMFDRVVHPRMRDMWGDWIALEGTHPILRQAVVIYAPRERPLARIAVKDEVRGTVSYRKDDQGDWTRHEWQVRDVPRMFPEPNMPPVHTVVQRLLVSTVPDWQTISRWYWTLSLPHYTPSEEMKTETAGLIRNATGRRQRIEELFRFVSQKIRYMGITVESTSPGYEPHDVKDTFAARHGVCRDKAALLVAMLRLAQIEAFPTLIHNGPKKDAEVPQPYFNHAIVAVREPDGRYLLMDPTDETTAELLPAYLNDKSYLVATPEGDALRTSPVAPAAENMMRIETRGRLDEAGGLAATSVFRFEGINDGAYRGWFARSKPEDRRRFFEGLVKRAAPGARLSAMALEPQDVTNTRTTLTATVSYTAPDLLIRGSDGALLPLPSMGTRIGMVNFLIGKTGLKERKYPLTTEIACGVREDIRLDAAAVTRGLKATPRLTPVRREDVTWSLDVQATGAIIRATADFRIEAVEFPPDRYLGLKETLKEVEYALRAMPILAPAAAVPEPAGKPDSVVTGERVEFALSDAGSWTETRTVSRRIVTYAGKKAYGEVKLSFNTAWEDLRLAEAFTVSPDGKRTAIGSNEVNVMDAPWVGSAPRYPAERTLVASLPALQEGSTLQYTYIRSSRGKPLFALREPLRLMDPLAAKDIRVRVPAAVAARVAVPDEASAPGFRRAEEEGHSILSWSATNAPAVRREDFLPPLWCFVPTARAGTGSWRQYADSLSAVLARASADQPESGRQAGAVAAGATNAWEKVRRVRDFVALRVREAGPGPAALPWSSITPADRTLADAYGNTTDRAVLLAAMLRALGFRPEFVLASELPASGPLLAEAQKLCFPPDFGTVLVRLRDPAFGLNGDQAVYLNDTDQYAAVGATAHEDRIGLDLATARTFAIAAIRGDLTHTEYALGVKPDGDATLRVCRYLHGVRFGLENRRFREMTPEERRRHHQELVGEVAQAAVESGDLVADFEQYPGRIEFAVKVPRYAVAGDGYLQFPVPDLFEGMPQMRADARENPLFVPARVACAARISVTLPEGYAVEYHPTRVEIESVPGLDSSASLRPGAAAAGAPARLDLAASAALGPGILAAQVYPELLRRDRALFHKRNQCVLLRKDGAPDGPTTGDGGN